MIRCSAKFVMVARDKNTKKSYQVPPLNFEKEPETFKIIHELGSQRQSNRKIEAKTALQITPPTYE